MPEQIGLTQFFAMEASEYLERLDAAVSRSPEPDREEFVRLTRALRGSALMANQQAFAAATSALERLARAVHDRSRPWDPATKQLAVRAIDDLKILVRKAATWTDAENHKAQQLADTLQAALGGAPAPAASARAAGPGQRAIIAQQGAGLASALEQAASALQQNPQVHTPLQVVLKTMQPLRGIAGLADHPPLPELLEGVERAVAALIAHEGPSPHAADLFRAAAKAISRAAQEVASRGAADPEAPEAHEFSRRLATLLEVDAEVVSIESLQYDDAGPHVVQRGTPPTGSAKLGALELVSHGEYLRQAADAMERSLSSVQREIRAHGLVGTFNSLATAGAGALGTALKEFGRVAREAVARGVAVANPKEFARHIREAGAILSGAAGDSETAMAQRLGAVTAALGGAAATAPAAALAAPASQPAARRPPAPSAAMVRPKAAAGTAAGAPAAAGAASDEAPGLVGSYQRHDQLIAALGLGSPSVEELLSGPPAWPLAAAAPAAAAADGIVSITSLFYAGDAAVQRLTSLREQVRAILAGASPDGAVLKDLVEEVFDLAELGAARGR
jgi:chemotaxis protein histidine kinase CheA